MSLHDMSGKQAVFFERIMGRWSSIPILTLSVTGSVQGTFGKSPITSGFTESSKLGIPG